MSIDYPIVEWRKEADLKPDAFSMSAKHQRFFDLARRMSFHVNGPKKIGSVLVQGSRILNVGWNQRKWNKILKGSEYASLHAEIDAILGFDVKVLAGASIYNYRETHWGKIANSKPCILCQEKLCEFGVKYVYYTLNEIPFFDKLKL